MRFVTLIRLPEAAHEKTTQPPTQLIAEAIEREDGKLLSMDGVNGGWDVCCRFECQTVEAQVRITMTLRRAGFITETRSCVEAAELDNAWTNAVKHPVAAGR